MSALLEKEQAVKTLFSDIRARLTCRAERGEEIPGQKLINWYGNTKWVDEAEAEKALFRKYGKRTVTTAKLMSPTQIKKLKDVDKSAIDNLVEREFKGRKLVPLSARGEALDIPNIRDLLDDL